MVRRFDVGKLLVEDEGEDPEIPDVKGLHTIELTWESHHDDVVVYLRALSGRSFS